MLRPFIVKVSVLGYFPLPSKLGTIYCILGTIYCILGTIY